MLALIILAVRVVTVKLVIVKFGRVLLPVRNPDSSVNTIRLLPLIILSVNGNLPVRSALALVCAIITLNLLSFGYGIKCDSKC